MSKVKDRWKRTLSRVSSLDRDGVSSTVAHNRNRTDSVVSFSMESVMEEETKQDEVVLSV